MIATPTARIQQSQALVAQTRRLILTSRRLLLPTGALMIAGGSEGSTDESMAPAEAWGSSASSRSPRTDDLMSRSRRIASNARRFDLALDRLLIECAIEEIGSAAKLARHLGVTEVTMARWGRRVGIGPERRRELLAFLDRARVTPNEARRRVIQAVHEIVVLARSDRAKGRHSR